MLRKLGLASLLLFASIAQAATIGYDSTVGVGGVTSTTAVQHHINYEFAGESLVASANERVTEVGFHFEGSTAGQLQIGVYRKDTLALVNSATVDGTAPAGRKTTAVNWPLTAGVEYIIGFRVVSTVSQYRASGGATGGRYSAETGTTPLANPFVIGTSTTHKFAVFATTEISTPLNILIIHGVSNTSALAMETILEGRADVVTLADDGAIPGDLSPYDAIVLSDSSAGTVGTLLSSTKGIVFVEDAEWIAYNLASSVSAGSAQTQVEVKSTTHPIAVDLGWSTLDALITVSSGSPGVARVNPGSLGAGGVRIADDSTTTDGRVVLFAYDTGAALISGNAAGRRVGWGHIDPTVWTTTGNDVLFASVDWAAGGATPAGTVVNPISGRGGAAAQPVLH